MIPLAKSQPEDESAYELVVFDIRVPGAAKRLVYEGVAWRGCAHVGLLDVHHAVLIVRAGGAARGPERRVA